MPYSVSRKPQRPSRSARISPQVRMGQRIKSHSGIQNALFNIILIMSYRLVISPQIAIFVPVMKSGNKSVIALLILVLANLVQFHHHHDDGCTMIALAESLDLTFAHHSSHHCAHHSHSAPDDTECALSPSHFIFRYHNILSGLVIPHPDFMVGSETVQIPEPELTGLSPYAPDGSKRIPVVNAVGSMQLRAPPAV